ncbi:MAG: hypothetical protein DYH13_02330 [Alphaproteobacteria bacterium PRO2]|nr:hypothetical protein [Alphaproteobacteria bacterium PRO2]
MPIARQYALYAFFSLLIALQVFAWLQVRTEQARWLNVPPVPGEKGAAAFALGDRQFAYRTIGVMLQNLGDTGGRVTSFEKYDYDRLAGWFNLADKMDPHANFVPMLAAFYFSATEDPVQIAPLADYLHRAGNSAEGERWRWLAQAVYLAHYKLKDFDKAYAWAQELAAIPRNDMPMWTKQMPAFVRNAEGDKQAAYDIMIEIMRSGQHSLPREEMNAMQYYICKRILDEAQAAKDPICQDVTE